MAKVQEIGPYSAYAIAVKYGYKGTEEEWVKEQEANRKAAEAAAAAAAQSAKDAAASASGVAQSGQQAVQGIKDAQTAAEQAIDTAKQQAVQAAQAEAEKAATSAGQAASSAAEAAQSATNAAAEVGKVQNAGTAAVQAVQQAQNTATGAVADAQQTATQAVSQAQTTAVSAVQAEGTKQTNAVAAAASAALKGISDAKDAALSDVAEAGEAQVSSVGTAGTSAVQGVNDAKTAALKEIADANAALPSPAQSDAGKVPTVKADGSAYELAGPYAPLSAAIRPTASGNPVNITDSVEWPLQGLKVYGKSTQVTTTGASLANPADFSVDDKFIYLFQQNPFEIKPGESYSFTFYNDDTVGQAVQVELRENGSNNLIDVAYTNIFSYTNHDETHHFVYFRVYLYKSAVPASYRIMLNAGPTALPWEPYTGGKPSPSPEYPQPIVSAGEGGSIALTVSDGAEQSQSLTIPTPNGLPGILVDSGGNYTDVSGQRWITDVVDLEKKQLIQRTYRLKPEDMKVFDFQHGKAFAVVATDVPTPDVSHEKAICNILNTWLSRWNNDSDHYFMQSANQKVVICGAGWSSVEDVQAAIDAGIEFIYPVAEPITTPLNEEEIAAYRALHTYDGTTVVSTAEDVAGLEVKYLADGEKYVERIVSQKASEAAAAHNTMALLADGIREGVNGV